MDAATPPLSLAILERPALQQLHLKRLRRLLRLRRQHEPELNRQGLRLLDRAVFAAYCACRDAGADGDARDVISRARRELRRAPATAGSSAAVPEPSSPGARAEG